MEKLFLICIDDQREVLSALLKELRDLKPYFEILDCESAAEAEEALDEVEMQGGELALIICDHVMPEKTGVQFLAETRRSNRFPKTRQILLTGLATQDDTIEAINQAQINRYLEKPWDHENLMETIKTLVTEYVVDSGLEYKSLLPVLDQGVLYKYLHRMG